MIFNFIKVDTNIADSNLITTLNLQILCRIY